MTCFETRSAGVLSIMVVCIVAVLGCVEVPIDNPALYCLSQYVDPVLSFKGRETYRDAFGDTRVRFNLSVTNWRSYPNSLFVAAPELPPCGYNEDSSRAWVHIYSETGTRLNTFCNLTSPSGLEQIWFSDDMWSGLADGYGTQERVYVEIEDRWCGNTYQSNLIELSTDGCAGEVSRLPDPDLTFVGCEEYTDAFGNVGTEYQLRVDNWREFPEELFEPAPELGPCGTNDEPSRTEVEIYAESGVRVYGFCDLDGPDGLTRIWCSDIQWSGGGGAFPNRVYVVMTDRLCNRSWTSNLAEVACAEQTGRIMGKVVDAQTGSPLSNVHVGIPSAGLGTETDSSGRFAFDDMDAGDYDLSLSKAGYADGSTTATVEAGAEVEITVGMVKCTGTGLIALVLTWGVDEQVHPEDLDLHMSGPDGQGGRFHVCWWSPAPVQHVFLDRDDTDFGGPETITIRPTAGGDFVAGEYRVWVHNYSMTPEFRDSLGLVSLTADCVLNGQYAADVASGDSSGDIWRVIRLNVSSSGQVTSVNTQQSYTDGDSWDAF